MRTTPTLAALAALIVLACCGCSYPTLEHPLVDPAQAKPLDKLYGLYRATETRDNEGDLFVHIGPASEDEPAGLLRILMVGHKADGKSPLDAWPLVGFVEPVGRYYVLHLPEPKEPEREDEKRLWDRKWDAQQVSGYFVVRLVLTDDGYELTCLNSDFIAEQIKSNQLSGRIEEKVVERDGEKTVDRRDIIVTAATDELQAFFKQHIDGKLFDERAWKFVRVGAGSDPPAP